VPLIRGNNLTKGEKLFKDEGFVFVTDQKAEELKSCAAIRGDLIFTAACTLGKVGLIPANSRFERYIISNKQLRARVDEDKASPLFLFYWFASPVVQKIIGQRKIGTSIPLITLSILKSIPIPRPSVSEQTRIASIISEVDAQIEKQHRAKNGFERLKKGLMRVLLTGQVRVKVN